MREAVIENPVINSAFVEPQKHFTVDDDGIACAPGAGRGGPASAR